MMVKISWRKDLLACLGRVKESIWNWICRVVVQPPAVMKKNHRIVVWVELVFSSEWATSFDVNHRTSDGCCCCCSCNYYCDDDDDEATKATERWVKWRNEPIWERAVCDQRRHPRRRRNGASQYHRRLPSQSNWFVDTSRVWRRQRRRSIGFRLRPSFALADRMSSASNLHKTGKKKKCISLSTRWRSIPSEIFILCKSPKFILQVPKKKNEIQKNSIK